MKESLNHALVITTLLERDIARICASGNETQQGLAADCAEHRRQLANKLRHIEHLSTMEADQSFKAGDFNGDEFRDIEQCSRELQSPERRNFDDINEPDDDTYLRHAAVSDHAAMVKYQAKIRRNGWILAWIAAAGAGVILAGIKIWFTYF